MYMISHAGVLSKGANQINMKGGIASFNEIINWRHY